MVAEVAVGTGVFAALLNSVKGLKDLNDAAVRNEVSIALQRQILEAQEAQFALVQQVRDLKAEIAGFEQWAADKQSYQLVKIGSAGIYAYRMKPGVEGSEPEHHICARCYEERHASILQPNTTKIGHWEVLSCPRCRSDFYPNGGGR